MNGLFTLSQDAIPALLQVIMIDLVLAGDNAVVIGLAAAGLSPERRGRAIMAGTKCGRICSARTHNPSAHRQAGARAHGRR